MIGVDTKCQMKQYYLYMDVEEFLTPIQKVRIQYD